LRSDAIGSLASVISAHPLVRASLLQRQRRFANQPGGAVLDGRDIGTVIAPEADAKLFIRATPTIRAKRRHAELRAAGSTISIDKVLTDIRARDLRDSTRSTAPLVPAKDSALLDTSFLSIEASVQRAIAIVEARRAVVS
jgi:cytidylate kinase